MPEISFGDVRGFLVVDLPRMYEDRKISSIGRFGAIRDYFAETFRASRMAGAGESGRSASIKSGTVCKIYYI